MIRVDSKTGRWQNPDHKRGKKGLRLIAAGDICAAAGWKYDELLSQTADAAEAVYGNLLPVLGDKDLSVANLEHSLGQGGEPIVKSGPNLLGPVTAIDGIAAGGFDAVAMANNHVLDFGPVPFLQSLKAVRAAGLAVVGAGKDMASAYKLCLMRRAGMRVSMLAFAENEFGNATRNSPGSAPLAPAVNCSVIAQARKKCDLLVVFVHGGSEFCPLPSPRMVRDYRSFVNAGADAVIGHHAHTVQGMELYRGVPIVYNLGNFLFWLDPAKANPLWWKSMFVRLTFAGRTCTSLEVHPFRTDFKTKHLKLLAGRARQSFLRRLNRLSEIISNADLHERFWQAYCLTQEKEYLGWLDRNLRGLQSDSDAPRRKAASNVLNCFNCEAHQDVVTTFLELMRLGRDRQPLGVEKELRKLLSSKG